MFKQFVEEEISRFREFDEARVYIEDFKDNKDTYEAIDYMISHKEFYFLLKNIKTQNPSAKIVEYIFYNLPCLKRKDDYELINQLKQNKKIECIINKYIEICKD